MPNYYTGADPTQAFSSGLMAGYEFIDRIKARKEALDLQKRQEERATQAFELEKQGFATQQEAAKFNLEQARTGAEEHAVDRKRALERQPKLEKQADDEAAARQKLVGIQTEDAQLRLQAEKDLIRGRKAYGDLLDSTVDTPSPTLGEIGMQGTQPRVGEGTVLKPGVQGGPSSAQQSQTTPSASAPAGPIDLRAAQAEEDARPNVFQRAYTAVKTSLAEGQKQAAARDVKGSWSEIANPQVSGKGRVYSERLPSVQIRDVRLNPEKYADAYLQDRSQVDPKDRPTLDATMLSATLDAKNRAIAEMKQLDPRDPKNQAKIAALTNQQIQSSKSYDALNKALAKDAGAAVLPNGGVTNASDPNVLPAVTSAKQQQDAAGVVPKVTDSSLRVTQTQLGRLDNPARLTKQQLGLLSEAFRTGAIDPTTYENWRRYGGPLQPAKPQIIPFSGGTGVVLYPSGQFAEINLGGGKGSKSGAGGANAPSFNQSMEFMKDTLNARIKKGDLPDVKEGTGINEVGKMMLMLQRHALQFQQQNPEIQLLGSDGEVSFEWMQNPLDMLKAMNWYVDTLNGVKRPDETTDPLPDPKAAARIIPTTPWVQ